jgi:hypothetical protein
MARVDVRLLRATLGNRPFRRDIHFFDLPDRPFIWPWEQGVNAGAVRPKTATEEILVCGVVIVHQKPP